MPHFDEAAVAAVIRRLRLGIDARRRRIGNGARLGAGAGSSLEFHDHRAYSAGDDLRHLDWGVYARTDQLVLRRHRQEVSPRIEVLLDLSASMAIAPAKLALATALAALIASLGESDGARPVLWAFTGAVTRVDADWRPALRRLAPGGAGGFEARPGPSLGTGSERFLISDGLCPAGGGAVVRALGQDAGRIALIQVLTAAERAPTARGAARLEDVEGGAADLVLDDATCAAYRERLARHQAGWQEALAGRGAGLVTCAAEDGLDGALRALLAAGVLEPRVG
jgi:uncharacterized protein (DUF58 family)